MNENSTTQSVVYRLNVERDLSHLRDTGGLDRGLPGAILYGVCGMGNWGNSHDSSATSAPAETRCGTIAYEGACGHTPQGVNFSFLVVFCQFVGCWQRDGFPASCRLSYR